MSLALVAAAFIVSRKAPSMASGPPQPSPLPSVHADAPQPTTAAVTAIPDAGAIAEAHVKPVAPPHGAPAKKPPSVQPGAQPTAKPPVTPPAANCSPNFTIVDGIKKIKPECL